MANLIKFESTKTIEKNREDLREARIRVIESAKEKYEKEERRKEQAKTRGEDTWMLASVSHRLEAEEEAIKKSKKKKKKEKHKKQKGKKKKKKKQESSSSSDSSSEEDEGSQWVEKGKKKKETEITITQGAIKGPRMERDSWMSAPLDLVPTVTRKDLIDKKNKEKQEMEEQKRLLEQPGRHAKELNPYWKDGGTGLPEEKPSSKVVAMGTGDSGLSWLRKSYQRCVEQAKEEGRSLEELAAERWGSLEKIQSMIREAEKLAGVHEKGERFGDRKNRFMRPGDGERSDSYKQRSRKSRSRSPSRHSNSSRRRSRSRSSERLHNRWKRSRSRDRDKRSHSREKDVRRRSRSKERYRHKRSNSRDRKQRSRSRSKDRNRRERSRSKERSKRPRSKERISSTLKGRFMKPGEMSENNVKSSSSRPSASSGAPAWKKREFHKPVETDNLPEKNGKREGKEEVRRETERRKRHASSSSSSSESSSSDSESSGSDKEPGQRSRSPETKVIPKILSETEMNALGAKILKAELMGNKEQAEKLKAQLEAAREAKKNLPAGGEVDKKEEKEDFVVLTRTDRSGMARPVPESKHERDSYSGKRKKKQKVETHSGKEGERVRYFADDDKFDLKTLVEREKMGTAEDQNSMFARLAGRAEKTQGDDFQVDDIFLSKANRKQAESVEEERDRARAVMEHRQMASSMEKCRFCFNKVEKHLIVALGTKVYLCLPATKSLTEGHCLIVPMQHVSSGTTVDEDVWNEIQLFRKTLTKMFAEREEDVVFMETSMKLKYFPHMSIECVPIEKEIGDMAPIYFKKAIQETGSEWSDNKKVVDISQKDIRHAVPKGFPYFSVDFGNQGGFAHVIEDERTFPTYFGKEIIGGMIDADHSLWRKPHRENFDSQRKKVLRFSEMWKPYDWTQNLSKSTQSDSDSDSD